MTEKLQALGYVSLKSNGALGIEELDNYQGILITKNLEQYKMLLYIFKKMVEIPNQRSGRFLPFLLYVLGEGGGSCLFFEALLVFEINHKR